MGCTAELTSNGGVDELPDILLDRRVSHGFLSLLLLLGALDLLGLDGGHFGGVLPGDAKEVFIEGGPQSPGEREVFDASDVGVESERASVGGLEVGGEFADDGFSESLDEGIDSAQFLSLSVSPTSSDTCNARSPS